MSKINSGLMTSESSEWETPQELFEKLNRTFNFTLDPCASHSNAKCPNYFTKEDNGLEKSWAGHRVFMNPPYGRSIYNWMEKACMEHLAHGILIVALIPARVDTKWWHYWVERDATVQFIQGRLKFSNSNTCAPFPSALAVYWSGAL